MLHVALLSEFPHHKSTWPDLSLLLGWVESFWVEKVNEGDCPSGVSWPSIFETMRKDLNVNLIIICYKIEYILLY